jgi:hypothetical protein
VSDASNSEKQAESNSSIPEGFERFVKDSKAETNDLLRDLKATAGVYIDNRSIGNYFEQEARVYGSVAGRDYGKQTTTLSGDVVGKILIENIEKICSVYVETPNYTQALSVLQEKHILVLSGNQNWGKQTTAVRLLSNLLGSEVFELNPAINNLSVLECEANQAYLIDTLTLGEGNKQKIDNYVVKSLSHKFKQNDSYLVITLDSRWHLSREISDDYILNWHFLPEREIILKKHLAWYLRNQSVQEEIDALIQDEGVQSLLNDNKLLPGDLDRLAELLAKVIRDELTPEEALSRLSIRVQQQVESWFAKHSDLKERVFFITLAVLSGSKSQAIEESSVQLQSFIQPKSDKDKDEDKDTETDPIFGKTRSSFLKELCASLGKGVENTNHGLSQIEIIQLDNSAFQPAILSYAWNEYSRLREPILLWLNKLGSHKNFDVSSRAAAAVGELSKYDFTTVLETTLQPWASSEDERLRKLAAFSLSIPVTDSNVAPQVLALLHHWCGLNNNFYLRWTATVAYGGYVGWRFPDIALRDLLKIVKSRNESENEQLFFMAAESITALFQAGKFISGQYLKVLNEIYQWIEQAKLNREKISGLLVFIFLAIEAKISLDSENNDLPTLLWLLWEEKEQLSQNPNAERAYKRTIVSMLRHSLVLNPTTRKIILEELHEWCKLADSDRRWYPVVGGIFYQLIIQGNEHEKDRIFESLKRWSSTDNSNTASKILSKIKQHLGI